MDLPESLTPIVAEQSGVLSRRQLTEHGVSIGRLRWQLGRSWRLVLPGVVLLGSSLPTLQQRFVAAQLYGGAEAWLAGPSAATIYGFLRDNGSQRVHLLVPPTAKPRAVLWVTVSRTRLVNERLTSRGPMRVSSRPRAIVDAAAVLPDDGARSLVIDAVRRREVRLDDLAHWVEARRSQGRVRLRRFLAEAAAGAWSLPEADLAALVRRSRHLSEPWLNPQLVDAGGRRLTTPDLWFDDVGMAVMVHSRAFHAGALQWDATVVGDEDLTGARIAVVGVTPEQLARSPAQVLRRIEARYAEAKTSGFRPDVSARPRDSWLRMA